MLWWNYGDETINSWKLTLTEEGFHITTLDGAQALAPVNGSTVALTEADITDPEQLWAFVPVEGTTGSLVQAATGSGSWNSGTPLTRGTASAGRRRGRPAWRIKNLTRNTALIPKPAMTLPIHTSVDQHCRRRQRMGKLWITV